MNILESIKWFFDQLGTSGAAFLAGILGTAIGGFLNYWIQERKFKHEKAMFFLVNKSSENAKEYLLELLNHRNNIDRSFETLKKRIGLPDEKVRELLLEIGCKRVVRSEDNSEWWYLAERTDERNAKRAEKGKKN
jgi:hypothetical protein